MSVQLQERVEQIQSAATNGVVTNGHGPIPSLESGDRLSRVEFERRYHLHPNIKKTDANGVIRSEIFPGLWLPTTAVWQGDLAKMLAVVYEGLASAEHALYVKSLQEKR